MDNQGEMMAPTAVEAISRAEVDIQIATAHRYERDIERFRDKALAQVTSSQAVAEDCMYSLPRGGKPIEGGSIRLAEIVANSWGNLRIVSRVVGESARDVTVMAAVHDLETNVAISVEKKRRVTDRNGRRFSDDMVIVTVNAATAIAVRDAIFKVVPRVYVNELFEAARKVAIGEASALSARVAKCLERLALMGAPEDRVLARIGKQSADAVTPDDIATLIGIGTRIKEGQVDVDEAFPVEKADDAEPDKLKAHMRKTTKKKPANTDALTEAADAVTHTQCDAARKAVKESLSESPAENDGAVELQVLKTALKPYKLKLKAAAIESALRQHEFESWEEVLNSGDAPALQAILKTLRDASIGT